MARSWADLTLDEAADELAICALHARRHMPTYQEKQAEGDLLTSLGQTLQQNPTLAHSLIGGGLGAVTGGVANFLGNQGRPEEERKSLLSGALTGGLAGGALGGGLSLLHRHFSGGSTPSPAAAAAPTTFMHNGRPHQLSPEALASNPELATRLRELAQPSMLGRVVGAGTDGVQTLAGTLPATTARLAWHGAGQSLWDRLTGARAHQRGQDLQSGVRTALGNKDTLRTLGANQALGDIGGQRGHLPDLPTPAEFAQRANIPGGNLDEVLHARGQHRVTRNDLQQHQQAGRTAREAGLLEHATKLGPWRRGARFFGPPLALDALLGLWRSGIENRQADSAMRRLISQHAQPVPQGQ